MAAYRSLGRYVTDFASSFVFVNVEGKERIVSVHYTFLAQEPGGIDGAHLWHALAPNWHVGGLVRGPVLVSAHYLYESMQGVSFPGRNFINTCVNMPSVSAMGPTANRHLLDTVRERVGEVCELIAAGAPDVEVAMG